MALLIDKREAAQRGESTAMPEIFSICTAHNANIVL